MTEANWSGSGYLKTVPFFFFDEVEIGFPYGMNKDLRAIIQTMLGFLFIIDYSSNIGFFYVL